MKYLLLVLVLFVTTLTFSQQPIDSLKITQTERIIDKYGGKIEQSFNAMVSKATPVVEQGFELVVKMQFVEGVTNIILSLLCLGVILLSFKKNIRESIMLETGGAGYMLLIFPIAIMLISGYKGIMKVCVPEWFAIKEILNLIN